MNLHTVATSSLVVALAFVAQACCGGLTRDEADKTLRVSLIEGSVNENNELAPNDVEPGTSREKLCGAEVIAVGDDGSEVPMEEIEADGGCEYVADVDPFTIYEIQATHPELGNGGDSNGRSNPACSVPTASEDIDNEVIVARPLPDSGLVITR